MYTYNCYIDLVPFKFHVSFCKTKASPEQLRGTELEVNSTPTPSLWTGPLVSNYHLCSVEGSGPYTMIDLIIPRLFQQLYLKSNLLETC